MSPQINYVRDEDLTLVMLLEYFDTLFEYNLPLCFYDRVEAARLAASSPKFTYRKLGRYFLSELNNAANIAATKEQ